MEPKDETKKFATLKGDLADRISRIAEQEHRPFANMLEVLAMEALDAREQQAAVAAGQGSGGVGEVGDERMTARQARHIRQRAGHTQMTE